MIGKEAMCSLHIPQNVCNEFEERAIDTDITLPDYCPDITAILKCLIRPAVSSCFQSGDRYTVDGMTTVRLLYLSEDRMTVHSYEMSQPFSVSFRSENAVHHNVEIKTDYVNCRAVSPRRVDIHGAFRVCLHAIGEGTVTVLSPSEQNGLFCRKQTILSTVPVFETDKSFVVDETIDLGVRADRMIYTDVCVASCDTKVLTNKLIVKGALRAKVFYGCGSERHQLVQEIPFSQIVDVEGLNDEWCCEVNVRAGECETYCQSAENGSAVLNMNCKMTACVRCSQTNEYDVALDAYSTMYPVLCETAPIHVSFKGDSKTMRTTQHQITSLPEGAVEVVDVWGVVKSTELKKEASGNTLCCCLLVCMIAADESGQLGYYERTVDCQIATDPAFDDVCVGLIDVTAMVAGNQLRVQAEMNLTLRSATHEHLTVVSSVIKDEQNLYEKTSAALKIIYPSVGESLWDIAKSYHTSVDEIVAENGLTGDTVTVPTMLMIPLL